MQVNVGVEVAHRSRDYARAVARPLPPRPPERRRRPAAAPVVRAGGPRGATRLLVGGAVRDGLPGRDERGPRRRAAERAPSSSPGGWGPARCPVVPSMPSAASPGCWLAGTGSTSRTSARRRWPAIWRARDFTVNALAVELRALLREGRARGRSIPTGGLGRSARRGACACRRGGAGRRSAARAAGGAAAGRPRLRARRRRHAGSSARGAVSWPACRPSACGTSCWPSWPSPAGRGRPPDGHARRCSPVVLPEVEPMRRPRSRRPSIPGAGALAARARAARTACSPAWPGSRPFGEELARTCARRSAGGIDRGRDPKAGRAPARRGQAPGRGR